MNKTYHFLSGFPRTGNTVLSSILNQNPHFYSSPLGPVRQYMHMLESHSKVQEGLLRTGDYSGSDNVIRNVITNYYENISKPVIFDRDKFWAEEDSFCLITKYITKNPKIIFTIRPVLEILTSFFLVYKNDPFKFIEAQMVNNKWNFNPNITMDDNICDFIMRPEGGVFFNIISIEQVYKKENKKHFHVVTYDELTNNPKKLMEELYEFIEQPFFIHNFSNIVKIENDNDLAVGMPENMHFVRSSISKKSFAPESVLSDYVLTKDSPLDKWVRELTC